MLLQNAKASLAKCKAQILRFNLHKMRHKMWRLPSTDAKCTGCPGVQTYGENAPKSGGTQIPLTPKRLILGPIFSDFDTGINSDKKIPCLHGENPPAGRKRDDLAFYPSWLC